MQASAGISVVIPTHRFRGYIEATMASVSSQLEARDEVLIIANGCDDQYAEYLTSTFGSTAKVHRISGNGIANARNWGAGASNGEILVFLDDDDELTSDALSHHRQALAEHTDVQAVVGEVITFGDKAEERSERFCGGLEISRDYLLLHGTPGPSPGAAALRRACFESIGGFREEVAPADDWDLWLRIASQYQVLGISQTTLRYRFHDARTSLNVSRMADSALRVLKEHNRRLTAVAERSLRARAIIHLGRWYLPLQRDALISNLRKRDWRAVRFDAVTLLRMLQFEARERIGNKVSQGPASILLK